MGRLLLAAAVALALAAAAAGARAQREHVPLIRVPAGFRAETFATGLERPTAMAYGPGGRLYVTQETGELVVVRGGRPQTLVTGLRTPLGLVWVGATVFVSQQGRLERLRLARGRLVGRRAILSRLPYGRHQQDNVVRGPDGRLYLGSGSTCDACREKDPRSAAILSLRPDGSDVRIVARGLRNPFGLAFRPGTGELYATVNERDDLGSKQNPEPAETVVRIRQGAFYGWPRCWPSARLLRMVGRCRGVTPPAAYLEPHSSADGLVFYDGRTFPAAYRGDLFVALWGQYLEKRFGRRVVRVELGRTGRESRVSVFASGFDHPIAVALDRRGALLVADHGRGVIYRIQARGKP